MNTFGRSLSLCFMTGTLLFNSSLVQAQGSGNSKNMQSDSCVEVEVDGFRTLPAECLTEKMAPAPRKGPPHNSALDSADVARQQPNEIGQFSQSALRNRMGNNLGKSAQPERPPR